MIVEGMGEGGGEERSRVGLISQKSVGRLDVAAKGALQEEERVQQEADERALVEASNKLEQERDDEFKRRNGYVEGYGDTPEARKRTISYGDETATERDGGRKKSPSFVKLEEDDETATERDGGRKKSPSFMKLEEDDEKEEEKEPVMPVFRTLLTEVGLAAMCDAGRTYTYAVKESLDPKYMRHEMVGGKMRERKLPDFEALGKRVADRQQQAQLDARSIGGGKG